MGSAPAREPTGAASARWAARSRGGAASRLHAAAPSSASMTAAFDMGQRERARAQVARQGSLITSAEGRAMSPIVEDCVKRQR